MGWVCLPQHVVCLRQNSCPSVSTFHMVIGSRDVWESHLPYGAQSVRRREGVTFVHPSIVKDGTEYSPRSSPVSLKGQVVFGIYLSTVCYGSCSRDPDTRGYERPWVIFWTTDLRSSTCTCTQEGLSVGVLYVSKSWTTVP